MHTHSLHTGVCITSSPPTCGLPSPLRSPGSIVMMFFENLPYSFDAGTSFSTCSLWANFMPLLSLSPQICLSVAGAGGGQDKKGTLWLEQPWALAWPAVPGETLAELASPRVEVLQESFSCGRAWWLLASLMGISRCPGPGQPVFLPTPT